MPRLTLINKCATVPELSFSNGAPSGQVMEPSSARFLDVLFERPEEFFPHGTFSGADPRLSSPLQDHAYGCTSEQGYEAWPSSREQGLNDSDTDDLLQLIINPNDVYVSRSPAASPESDSGISDDPRADTPLQNEGPTTPGLPPTAVYEVICDRGMVEREDPAGHIFSNTLGAWTPPGMLPEACMVGEVSPSLFENAATPSTAEISRDQDPFQQLHLPGLFLTDEEKRLLSQEGVSLGCNLPLTKVEERILKKVRRKIRNKQSAQDSRRRKKEYIDGLESRVAACSAQNQELQKKVQELEDHNVSLLSQLQRLHGLIKQTSTKAAQTSTCLVILIFSLGLLILPNCGALLGRTQVSQDGYKPSGVISRTILNDNRGFSEPEGPPGADAPAAPAPRMQGPEEGPDPSNGQPPAVSKRNTSAAEAPRSSQTGPKEELLDRAKRPPQDKDPAKQMHADEM
ncbi:cyclic AMP-responsive element-binding protein 3-like protein 4 [Hemicordylus capensis]|uniref:cyclic AMP-responsive element-binding protein 3-like protein 4 n=1 Tax=Hemicordylus capensis TaxID=884348 RepID=UPI0023031446|nr:cyclic AMP-responsive element-binding protein 3-like protein 4 [Hemicordylus capensis]